MLGPIQRCLVETIESYTREVDSEIESLGIVENNAMGAAVSKDRTLADNMKVMKIHHGIDCLRVMQKLHWKGNGIC